WPDTVGGNSAVYPSGNRLLPTSHQPYAFMGDLAPFNNGSPKSAVGLLELTVGIIVSSATVPTAGVPPSSSTEAWTCLQELRWTMPRTSISPTPGTTEWSRSMRAVSWPSLRT
ncbi:hypothetical protein R3Q06_35000, partial [Rhodococcus erythropolis]|uniref:hypothetical protein n=1 Tax=Rhodococcus erythropolis TaxID=1833 RepID=UPI0029490476